MVKICSTNGFSILSSFCLLEGGTTAATTKKATTLGWDPDVAYKEEKRYSNEDSYEKKKNYDKDRSDNYKRYDDDSDDYDRRPSRPRKVYKVYSIESFSTDGRSIDGSFRKSPIASAV